MIKSAVLLCVLIAGGALAETGPGLASYRWKSRLLVISAPRAEDPSLKAQVKLLQADSTGLQERDLVTIQIVGDRVTASDGYPLPADLVRKAAGLSAGRFGVALIGKDGNTALRRAEPISPHALFQTIDAMPMRRDEMKRRG